MDQWSLLIDAWVIQDGNYPDFTRGQRAEFAVEFYAPEALTKTDGGSRSALALGDGSYSIEATVAAVSDDGWVIDCGLLVYDEDPPEGLVVGDGLAGEVRLCVDHFHYFEVLAKRPEIPSLIYTWDIRRIHRDTTPVIWDVSRSMYVRDARNRQLVETQATDAWADDGHSYLLDCDLLGVPPKRTSMTSG